MMNGCYCEGQTEHGKVAVNPGDNFATIRKNDSERGVLYRQERKAKRDCAALRLRVEDGEIRRRRVGTA